MSSLDTSGHWSRRILVLLLVIVLGLGVYGYLQRDVLRRWFAQDLIGREMEILSARIANLEEQLQEAREEIEVLSPSTHSDKVQEVFGVDAENPVEADAETAYCSQLSRQLQNLFSYLDTQGYAAPRGAGARETFRSILDRLAAHPPIVSKETESILRVLQNSAHFFRVLGKDDTLLVGTVLKNEVDIMEPTFALLYDLVGNSDRCTPEEVEFSISLSDSYQYAAYFLNTLGGQSYLLRRDSRVRMLAQYYAILIVDRANDRKLNEWGLDLRPSLEHLTTDMKTAPLLVRKKEYLKTLTELRGKYAGLYGD